MIDKYVIFNYECNTLCFATVNNIAQLKFDFFFFKLNFLKIHIKINFGVVFSPMIDVQMYIKVKSYVTFKNICQIES